ncbi:hypothetical protein [Rhizobium sp. BK376]|uniref:hypothetical protein n=1 Tax=Rhizobium sp. BK376 TaxID=2512149 RepID=UPI001A9DC823|nr:hypothetical protein [Rhizobium sp. BK376]
MHVGIRLDQRQRSVREEQANITKKINVSWSAGDASGGLDATLFTASATFFLHAIRKISDRSFDAEQLAPFP